MVERSGGVPLLQTVGRAVGVLEQLLARKDEPMTVAELAKALRLNRTTTWRLVLTLEALGYLERYEGDRFRLGLRLFYYATIIRERFDVRRLAEPVMERLRQESNESVYLWVEADHSRVCIHALESNRPIRHQIAVGEIVPLSAGGAAGKLLLACKPLEELETVRLESPHELRQELEEIRRQGYAISRGERFSESFSVAAPIRDHCGSVVAVLSIAGPSARMSEEEERHRDRVCAAAGEVSRLMGYQPQAEQAG